MGMLTPHFVPLNQIFCTHTAFTVHLYKIINKLLSSQFTKFQKLWKDQTFSIHQNNFSGRYPQRNPSPKFIQNLLFLIQSLLLPHRERKNCSTDLTFSRLTPDRCFWLAELLYILAHDEISIITMCLMTSGVFFFISKYRKEVLKSPYLFQDLIPRRPTDRYIFSYLSSFQKTIPRQNYPRRNLAGARFVNTFEQISLLTPYVLHQHTHRLIN